MKYTAAFLFGSSVAVAAARSRLDQHARPSVFLPLNAPCNRFATVDVARELATGTQNALALKAGATDFPTISIPPLSREQRRAINAAELGYTVAELEAGDERARQAQAKRDRKNKKRKGT